MTIEEKAEMYAYSVDRNRGKRWCEAKRDYFIAATDQFELDINRACMAHCALCEYNIKDDCVKYAYVEECNDIKSIIKAMERV